MPGDAGVTNLFMYCSICGGKMFLQTASTHAIRLRTHVVQISYSVFYCEACDESSVISSCDLLDIDIANEKVVWSIKGDPHAGVVIT